MKTCVLNYEGKILKTMNNRDAARRLAVKLHRKTGQRYTVSELPDYLIEAQVDIALDFCAGLCYGADDALDRSESLEPYLERGVV